METFVEFESCGLLLRGMIHLPERRGRAPGVLFLHGFTGQRMESHFLFVKTARALAEAGVASLRFDFAGSGESEGCFEDMSVLTELADARTALALLSDLREVDGERLGVLGLSMGGCVAGMLLEDARLRSGILWSAVADLSGLMEQLAAPCAAQAMAKNGYVARGAHKVGGRFMEDAKRADPLGGVSRSRADILIVHGTADPTVPVEHARMFERAARGREGPRSELVLIPDAGHTYEELVHEARVIREACAWFGKTLAGR